MRTTIDIDQDLLKEALAIGHCKTKSEVVNEALAEYVRIRKQRRIIELFGTIDYDPEYNYKAERNRR